MRGEGLVGHTIHEIHGMTHGVVEFNIVTDKGDFRITTDCPEFTFNMVVNSLKSLIGHRILKYKYEKKMTDKNVRDKYSKLLRVDPITNPIMWLQTDLGWTGFAFEADGDYRRVGFRVLVEGQGIDDPDPNEVGFTPEQNLQLLAILGAADPNYIAPPEVQAIMDENKRKAELKKKLEDDNRIIRNLYEQAEKHFSAEGFIDYKTKMLNEDFKQSELARVRALEEKWRLEDEAKEREEKRREAEELARMERESIRKQQEELKRMQSRPNLNNIRNSSNDLDSIYGSTMTVEQQQNVESNYSIGDIPELHPNRVTSKVTNTPILDDDFVSNQEENKPKSLYDTDARFREAMDKANQNPMMKAYTAKPDLRSDREKILENHELAKRRSDGKLVARVGKRLDIF